jgi:hypothetical protein
MATITTVKFKKRFESYIKNDIAGFPQFSDKLKEIVDGDFAEVLETKELNLNDPKIDGSWSNRVPKVSENLICPICGKKFKTKLLLTAHKKDDHAIK